MAIGKLGRVLQVAGPALSCTGAALRGGGVESRVGVWEKGGSTRGLRLVGVVSGHPGGAFCPDGTRGKPRRVSSNPNST
jgi:hypothetical protein